MAVDLKNLIDINLLGYFKSKIDLLLVNKVDKIDGKTLSSNDYTSEEKTKLSGISNGAQVNIIEGIQVAGNTISPVNKIINIPVATQSSPGVMNINDKKKLDSIDMSLIYTKNEIDQKLVGAMCFKGTKETFSSLPSTGNLTGDVWHIIEDGSEWAWNGSAWEELGVIIDLSGYLQEDNIGIATNDDIDAMFV